MVYEARGLSILFPTYQIFTALAFVLCIIPIPAHWRAGNVATVSLGLWNAGGNLIALTNTLVWRGNLRNPHPVWGDITAFYWTNMAVAIAGCALAIVHRLYKVSKSRKILITKAEKRRQLGLTWFLCWGVPSIQGAIHIVVQGHRYNVFEDVGPFPTIYLTYLSFIVYFVWEPLICLISAVYCVLTIRWYLRQRKEIDAMLGKPSVRLNKNAYIRLLALSAVGIGVHLPISTILIITNVTFFPIRPWTNWDDVHSNWSRIGYMSRFIIDSSPYSRTLTIVSFSMVPLSGFCYFIFFGFGKEAFRQYKAALMWLLTPLGLIGIELPRATSATSSTVVSDDSDGARTRARKQANRFAIFALRRNNDVPSRTAPVSTGKSISLFTTYFASMFSSFGTVQSKDLKKIDRDMSLVMEKTRHDSQSQLHPHESLNFGPKDVQLPPMIHLRPDSAASTLGTSITSDGQATQERATNITERHHSYVHPKRRSSEQLNAIVENEKADPPTLSEQSSQTDIGNPLSCSNQKHGDLEAGIPVDTQTPHDQFQEDQPEQPELTEEVTF